MFCSQCGAQATAKFCSQCGAALTAMGPSGANWEDEIRYEVLLRFPEVRNLIAKSASMASKGLSGDKFIELCDKALSPFAGVSLSTVAAITIPIASRLGIRIGTSQQVSTSKKTGRVIVDAVCALAKRGWKLKDVKQGSDGCVVEGEIPADFWAWTAELLVTIHQTSHGTVLETAANVPGQWYDWGKTQAIVNGLLSELAPVPPRIYPPMPYPSQAYPRMSA